MVRYFLNYKEITGCSLEEIELTGEEVTVEEVFKILSDEYSIKYEDVMERGVIMLNNKSVAQLEEKDTPIKDGDKLALIPSLSGG